MCKHDTLLITDFALQRCTAKFQFKFCIPNSNQVHHEKKSKSLLWLCLIRTYSIQKLFSEWIWSTWTSYLSFRWAAWKIMTLILQISHFWPAQQRNHHYTILLICCTQNGFKALFKLLFDVYFRPFYLFFDVLSLKRIKNQANLDKKYRKKQVSLDHIYLFFKIIL